MPFAFKAGLSWVHRVNTGMEYDGLPCLLPNANDCDICLYLLLFPAVCLVSPVTQANHQLQFDLWLCCTEKAVREEMHKKIVGMSIYVQFLSLWFIQSTQLRAYEQQLKWTWLQVTLVRHFCQFAESIMHAIEVDALMFLPPVIPLSHRFTLRWC